jgi:DNA-binding transcriptional ArsR family regulator
MKAKPDKLFKFKKAYKVLLSMKQEASWITLRTIIDNPGVNVSRIVELVALPQPHVSIEIGKLYDAGIIEFQPIGTERIYRPTDRAFKVFEIVNKLAALWPAKK